jgi:hypothetical protein
MKKTYAPKPNTSLVPHPRSFSRRIKQLFASILKRQDFDYRNEVIQRLQNIEDMLDIIARQMRRQMDQ